MGVVGRDDDARRDGSTDDLTDPFTRVVRRPVPKAQGAPISLRGMIALVVSVYGMPAGGMFALSVREFWLLWAEMPRVRQFHTLLAANGAGLAISVTMGPKDGPTVRVLEQMEREVWHG